MSSKIIVIFAALCVVKAFVMNTNSINDEPGNLLRDSIRNCNYIACNLLCHRLGLTGGGCVDNHCKCAQEAAVSQSVRCCEYQECEQDCRGLGFEHGACIKERCKCSNSLNDHVTDDQNAPRA